MLKTNALLSLISYLPNIDKMYLYDGDPYEAKYQSLIRECEGVSLKDYNYSKVFIKQSNDMGDVYEKIKKYNSNKECKIFIAFYMFADMPSNKKLQQIVIKLFIRFRKLKVCLVFITQSYFNVPKYIRLNSP